MFAVVRVRGSVHMREGMKRTLALLNLNRVNRMAVVPEEPGYAKMLKKAEAYITWGELSRETLERALEKRARTSLKKRVSGEFLEGKKLKSLEELAGKIEQGATLKSLGLKPFFALKPPSKGFERKGIKKSYSIGGALGYRGKNINALVERMI